MSGTWTAITVTAARPFADAIESVLLDLGAPGLETEERGEATRITAHFADAPPLAELDRFLDGLVESEPALPRPRVETATVTDCGWAENWKGHFPPLAIGERLFVHPPWIDQVPAGRVPIVLDPGMAFGTGQHASTRGCLVLLEPALRDRPAARVLDLGTGSGILAIAARKLGAGPIWAIDTDPDACAIAAENAAVNGVHDLRLGGALAAAPGPFDVVLANLLAGLLVELAPAIAGRLAPGGVAIGAGILAAEAGAVRDAWGAAGLVADGEWSDEGWVALAYRKPA
ncbi:50S ribosomal protein L11 methyltransferase [bacterium]|nr:50S ribosomal protein L11 methyltransferase [bacterium]